MIKGLMIFAGTLGMLFLLAWSLVTPATAMSDSQMLVPTSTRPLPSTPTSTPVKVVKNEGGVIGLHVTFPQDWPWSDVPWQDMWTGVQWQDDQGVWHDVEGWQGELDFVDLGENDEIVGKKSWWVSEADLGKGPFRWMVYHGKEGFPIATSESFLLPSSAGTTSLISISLQSWK
jgi:hypothetical protein